MVGGGSITHSSRAHECVCSLSSAITVQDGFPLVSFQSNQRVDLYKWKDGSGEVSTTLQGHTRVIR